jgi:hypothetical protein
MMFHGLQLHPGAARALSLKPSFLNLQDFDLTANVGS